MTEVIERLTEVIKRLSLKSGQSRNQTIASRKTASLASQNSFPSSLIGVLCALSINSIYLDKSLSVTVNLGEIC